MSATLVVFGLFDGDQLAGITAINRESADTATLAMSYIRPAWRGCRHSGLLYKARLDWARDHRVRRIRVSHRASNVPSQQAIMRHRFRLTSTQPHHWPDGTVEDDVSYELVVEPSS